MALDRSLDDEEFSAGIALLVRAWEENLRQAEPNRQRVFSDYQLLSDAGLRLTQMLRSARRDDAAISALRTLADKVSACLAFATVPPQRTAALKRHLFSGRSRGCRSGPAPLEVEIMESLDARGQN